MIPLRGSYIKAGLAFGLIIAFMSGGFKSPLPYAIQNAWAGEVGHERYVQGKPHHKRIKKKYEILKKKIKGFKKRRHIPPHLDILSASITEGEPFDDANVVNRPVILRIEVAGPPPCRPGREDVAYGFLIDGDKSKRTGARSRAFHPLGVDAQITARCDPTFGIFFSPISFVSVDTAPKTQATTIEIPLTVGVLPSVDFHWIAFAMDGKRFSRLPGIPLRRNGSPDHAKWATFERDLF